MQLPYDEYEQPMTKEDFFYIALHTVTLFVVGFLFVVFYCCF